MAHPSLDDRSLDADDLALFEQARELLTRAHHPERHQVAAALRSASGRTYLGLHIGSRRVNVCAESSAIANAQMAGDEGIATIVAVCKDDAGRVVVTNPCGVCRELMGTYGRSADVLVDLGGAVRKVRAADLLPTPWQFPRENDWSVQDPSIGAAP
ncbi:hypothetical protein [Blastococcus sp. PRF04-17]|uniref:hypothetical protein n=1 Tax=Blastococcus sp. PRF04-17 TaxID=2933797 RepID=UPI001FF4333A|nr:hypothetical protein [Blastococcus sp. PRF04-17]UOY03347.1 hypothetical protein MVA48_08445 [Blastococcus sp. PRF04-17]